MDNGKNAAAKPLAGEDDSAVPPVYCLQASHSHVRSESPSPYFPSSLWNPGFLPCLTAGGGGGR